MVGIVQEQSINFRDKFFRGVGLSWNEANICKGICKINNCMKCFCHFDNVTATYMQVMCRECEHRIYDVKSVFEFHKEEFTIYQIKKKEKVIEQKSFVYFISDGEKVKIGKANNVESRLKSLQTSHAKELSLIKCIKCKNEESAYKKEKQLHKKFDEFRITGEWFDILEFIMEEGESWQQKSNLKIRSRVG